MEKNNSLARALVLVVSLLLVQDTFSKNCVGALMQAIDVADAKTVAVLGKNVDVNAPLGDHQNTVLMLALQAVADASDDALNFYSWKTAPKIFAQLGLGIGAVLFVWNTACFIEELPGKTFTFKTTIGEKISWVRDSLRTRNESLVAPVIAGLISMAVAKKLQSQKNYELEQRRAVVGALLEVPGIDLYAANVDGKTVFDLLEDYMIKAFRTHNTLLRDNMVEVEKLLLANRGN